MKKICVVHLVRKKNGIKPFKRFIESYKKYRSGLEHDFLIVFKGFNQLKDLKQYHEILKPLNYFTYEISDKGYDLTAYFSVARVFSKQYHFFFFINSFSEILDVNWLKKLHEHASKPEVGLVGATGSWQSHIPNQITNKELPFSNKLLALVKKRKLIFIFIKLSSLFFAYMSNSFWVTFYLFKKFYFPIFRNEHIRTNSFLISSSVFKKLKIRTINSKFDAYIMESGFDGISRQIIGMGKKILVVGKNGRAYEKEDWYKSHTFWQFNQNNLLVSDNQTRDYQFGSIKRRSYLTMAAWGSIGYLVRLNGLSGVPKVSVCIPVRNAGDHLHMAVDSVLRQTYINYELIIIDNASTDSSLDWVSNLSANNEKIKFYKNKKNIGLVENFNACLTKATGKYVKFLCADDVLMPECLEQMVAALEFNDSATLVTSRRILINNNNQFLATKSYSKKTKLVNGKEVINRCMYGANYIGEPSATMFRREILAAGFDAKFPHLVDLELWYRILEHGDLICISKPLCSIRQHELQMTQSNIKSSILVEDNIRLFEMYQDKVYIKHNFIKQLNRKMRMAYRVWISRKYISNKRKNQIIKIHSNYIFYYLVIPFVSFLIGIKRKLHYQFFTVFI